MIMHPLFWRKRLHNGTSWSTVNAQVIPWLNEGTGAGEQRKQKFVAKKTFEQLSYLAQIYTPYTFYKCRYDD